MTPIPWQAISSWNCIACGECCREYTINISINDWARITRVYGADVVKLGLTECYLRKRPDNRCIFQYLDRGGRWLCGLQHMKPSICKLWPFKIQYRPTYKREKEAEYLYKERLYYVYVDPFCRGVSYGHPSWSLKNVIIPEFIELATKGIERQVHSTSHLIPPYQSIILQIKDRTKT
ncbi:YkgJ family cysteine cluster protein [[Eubacterium] cellulosolvens]